jgi:hypothetical protein
VARCWYPPMSPITRTQICGHTTGGVSERGPFALRITGALASVNVEEDSRVWCLGRCGLEAHLALAVET